MKKIILCALVFCACLIQHEQAKAQIIDIISSAIKKAITALDIKVQQLQNQTIMLQNAEKELENQLSFNGLTDVGGWLDKERNLFSGYYQELAQVKAVISGYDEVAQIIKKQSQLVVEYKSAYTLFKQDKNFTPSEIDYMGKVYNGILNESLKNLDEVMLAVSSLQTQMTDGQRLELIHRAGGHVQGNLNDLRQFNSGNMQLTLYRAKEANNMQAVKQLYGLQ